MSNYVQFCIGCFCLGGFAGGIIADHPQSAGLCGIVFMCLVVKAVEKL